MIQPIRHTVYKVMCRDDLGANFCLVDFSSAVFFPLHFSPQSQKPKNPKTKSFWTETRTHSAAICHARGGRDAPLVPHRNSLGRHWSPGPEVGRPSERQLRISWWKWHPPAASRPAIPSLGRLPEPDLRMAACLGKSVWAGLGKSSQHQQP